MSISTDATQVNVSSGFEMCGRNGEGLFPLGNVRRDASIPAKIASISMYDPLKLYCNLLSPNLISALAFSNTE